MSLGIALKAKNMTCTPGAEATAVTLMMRRSEELGIG
jgi:hypothetical protein